MERKKSWKSDLLVRSREDPVFFIENVLGGELWEKQKEICRALVKHERIAVAAAFGLGKCVAFGERLVLADGSVVLSEELIGKSFTVLAWDEKTGKQIPSRAFAEANGIKPVYRITTVNGRTVVRTGNHPLFSCYLSKRNVHRIPVMIKWRPIKYLREGMAVAVPQKLNVLPKARIPISLAKLTGYLLGDGATTVGLVITQKEGKTLDEIRSIVNEHNCDLKKIKNSKYDYRIVGRERTHDNVSRLNPLLNWCKDNQLIGSKSKDKVFPDFVWTLEDDLLAIVLNRLFACDGWAYTPLNNKNHGASGVQIAITLASERMIRDVELAMLRLGICGNVAYGKKSCNGKEFDSWTWLCNKAEEILKFYEIVGIFGKEEAVQKVVDFVLKHTSFHRLLKWPFKNIPENCIWDRIKSIECIGERPTVSICVPEYNTYLSTFVEHNTHLAARLCLWWLYSFPNSKVVSTAPTQRQVKDLLWSELRTAYNKSTIKLGGELLQLMLKISEDHFAVGFSTDSENIDRFTGYHAPNQLVVFDQAGGIETPIWEAAEGLMTSANCKWLAISNTAISSCELANICMPDRKTKFGNWEVIRIKATETPNVLAGKNVIPGLIAHDWVKKREEAWGKDDPLYKIFVEAEFIPDSEMVVVPYNFILKAFDSEGELGQYIEVGLDVARMGTDSTVWIARSGSRALEIKRVTGNNTMQVVGETIEFKRYLEEKYGMPVLTIKVDVIGLGSGVYDRLIELDEPALAVNNAEVNSVIDKERYSNIRAEMAWAFRYRMEHEGVGLANIYTHDAELKNYLRGDIQAIRYKITSQGKIQILQKDEIRKNLGRSPDYWDAAVMAFESPGGGIPSVEFLTEEKKEQAFEVSEDEWQILLGNVSPIDHFSFREVKIPY